MSVYVNDKGYITATRELSQKEKENGYLYVDLSKPIRWEELRHFMLMSISIVANKEKDIVFLFAKETFRDGNELLRLVAWKRYEDKMYCLKQDLHPYVLDLLMNGLPLRTLDYRGPDKFPTEIKKIGYNKYLIYFG